MKEMKNKSKIKVIKKNDIGAEKKPVDKEEKTKDLSTRAMVSTVSKWVEELQTERFKEAKAAVDRLYTHQPENA